jgi:Tol biopolymer transport system component
MLKKISVFLIVIILFNTCSTKKSITSPSQQQQEFASTSLYFYKPAFVDSLVTSANVLISASDMDTIQSSLNVTDTSVFGTVENIPAGLNRKFEVFCYDNSLNLTYYGHTISDVAANAVLTLDIVLYPVNHTGTVIINGTFSAFPQSEQKIVFQGDNSGTYDIYIMNADGSNLIQLTNSPNADWYPQISPDRNQIVFVRNENSNFRPYIMNIDGSNLLHLNILSNASVGFCGWSPDGSKLALHARENLDADIYIYDFSTELTTKIVENNAQDWIPRWSPDGSKIVFYSDMNGIFKTYTINPDGSGLSLIFPNNNTEERNTIYSPDGTKFAMTGRNIYAQWGIFTANTNGTNFNEVLNTPGVNEHYPVWSPDGTKILYKRFDGGANGYGLYIVNQDGTNNQVLLDTQYNEYNPDWR